MRGYKIECDQSHEHYYIYPSKQLKNPFTEKNIGQIFIRTAPLLAQNFLENDNFIGIPKPIRSSVEKKGLKLTNIQMDGSLDFRTSSGDELHLPKDYNDRNWSLAEGFLELLNDKDIVCKLPPAKVDKWSEWVTQQDDWLWNPAKSGWFN